MDKKEAIYYLQLLAAEIEWDHNLEYQVAINVAIECIEDKLNEETIKEY